MSGEDKVIVVMPAYNAAETLVETYRSIPPDCVDKVILVDDGSIDETSAVAEGLDLELIVHPHNAGYGANQKTCYMEALRQGAEIIIMLHPDGQYDPVIIPDMIARRIPCDEAGSSTQAASPTLKYPGPPGATKQRHVTSASRPASG